MHLYLSWYSWNKLCSQLELYCCVTYHHEKKKWRIWGACKLIYGLDLIAHVIYLFMLYSLDLKAKSDQWSHVQIMVTPYDITSCVDYPRSNSVRQLVVFGYYTTSGHRWDLKSHKTCKPHHKRVMGTDRPRWWLWNVNKLWILY